MPNYFLVLFLCLSLKSAFSQSVFCFPHSLSCKYYSCLEEEMQCGEEAYLLNYGKRYCEKFQTEFTQNLAILSLETQKWRLATSLCLQKEAQKSFKAGASCEELEESAYSVHPLCYTNHEQSFCKLPAKDITFILTKVFSMKELLTNKKMHKQIYETAKICLGKKKEERGDYNFKALLEKLNRL